MQCALQRVDARVFSRHSRRGYARSPRMSRLGPSSMSLGNDAQWNWYLEEAFVAGGLWKGPVKPGLLEAFHLSPEERFGGKSRDA